MRRRCAWGRGISRCCWANPRFVRRLPGGARPRLAAEDAAARGVGVAAGDLHRGVDPALRLSDAAARAGAGASCDVLGRGRGRPRISPEGGARSHPRDERIRRRRVRVRSSSFRTGSSASECSRTSRSASALRSRLQNLAYCFAGVALGTLIGVLPGIGPLSTIGMLFPITFYLPPVPALIMLAGIYYGAQYGGAITSILLNLPGETARRSPAWTAIRWRGRAVPAGARDFGPGVVFRRVHRDAADRARRAAARRMGAQIRRRPSTSR